VRLALLISLFVIFFHAVILLFCPCLAGLGLHVPFDSIARDGMLHRSLHGFQGLSEVRSLLVDI
jgi:hypothetical protein